MRVNIGFKIFLLVSGILITILSILSFNELLLIRLISYLKVEPFLLEKAIKYLSLYRLTYLSLGIILSFLSFSLFIPIWQNRLRDIYRAFDKKQEYISHQIELKLCLRFLEYFKLRPKIVLFTGFFLSLIFALILAWQDIGLLLSKFIYDDLYCYLQVARNIVTGGGATFDGVNPTNGFHPLWMLYSIILQFCFSPYPNFIVHIILTTTAIFHILIAYFMYKLIFSLGHRWAGVSLAIFWTLNYNMLSISLSGLETALFGFLLVFTLYTYLKWRHKFSLLRLFIIALLASLTTLARFDGFLFFIFLNIDYMITQRKSSTFSIASSILMPVVFLLSLLPWFIWSYSTVGVLLPITGQAKSPFMNLYPELGFLQSSIKRILLQIGWFHYSLPGYLRIIGAQSLFGKIIWFIIAIIILPSIRKIKEAIKPIVVFLLYALAHVSYYAFLIVSVRYAYPSIIIFLIAIGLILGNNYSFIKKKVALIVILVPFLVLALISDARYAWKNGFAGVKSHSLHSTMYYDVVGWMKKNTPRDAVIGSFNPGVYGYYSGRRIVNLDGFINNSAYYAIKNKRLFSYIEEQKVSYVIDWDKDFIQEQFEKNSGEIDFRKHFHLIESIEQKWGPYQGKQVLIYRIIY